MKDFDKRPTVGYMGIENWPQEFGSHGDWTIISKRGIPKSRAIQRANDIEGWYEYLVREPKYYPKNNCVLEQTVTHLVRTKIRFIYFGKDSKYKKFKL